VEEVLKPNTDNVCLLFQEVNLALVKLLLIELAMNNLANLIPEKKPMMNLFLWLSK